MKSEAWQPLLPEEVKILLQQADFPWWIAGGWALDLFVGHQTRPHEDIDVGIFRESLEHLRKLLPNWDMCSAHGNKLTPWSGGALVAPGNDLWIRETRDVAWQVQIMLNDGGGNSWVNRRDANMQLSLQGALRTTTNGIAYLAPQIQLLFKSKNSRPKDSADAATVIPLLTEPEREWLANAIRRTTPEHPWLKLLSTLTRGL